MAVGSSFIPNLSLQRILVIIPMSATSIERRIIYGSFRDVAIELSNVDDAVLALKSYVGWI